MQTDDEWGMNPDARRLYSRFIAIPAACGADRADARSHRQERRMKFDRLRQPAISALAILTISGAGAVMAANRTGSAAPAVAAPAVQAVAPAQLPVLTEPVEPTGPDTDLLQEGDQTTPDVATATMTSAGTAATANGAVKAAVKAAAPATGPESASEAAGTETESAGEAPGSETDKSDGPGGHADDPNDPNADHQFEGEE
jgi:hypothetical protein